jgi:putative ABC transport system substrate-binding protein
MQPLFVDVPAPTDLSRAFEYISSQRAQALVVRADRVFEANREQILRLANGLSLPTMTEGRLFVEAGALASYAPNYAEMNLRTAALVDKILRGAKPADLPIEQPTEFELLVNLKTAKVLGLSISDPSSRIRRR